MSRLQQWSSCQPGAVHVPGQVPLPGLEAEVLVPTDLTQRELDDWWEARDEVEVDEPAAGSRWAR